MSHEGVAINFVRSAIDATRSAGFDVRHTMHEVQLPPAATMPGVTHLDCERAVALMRSLWRLTDDELLHLGARPVPRGTFRMVTWG